jgi:hypothetical protein
MRRGSAVPLALICLRWTCRRRWITVAFRPPPAVGESLPSARTADLSEDGEALDSDDDDDDDLRSVKQILASSKRAKRVIDLKLLDACNCSTSIASVP